jgi:hypothetical protein
MFWLCKKATPRMEARTSQESSYITAEMLGVTGGQPVTYVGRWLEAAQIELPDLSSTALPHRVRFCLAAKDRSARLNCQSVWRGR